MGTAQNNGSFDCSANFYQVISGVLKQLDPATGTYVDIQASANLGSYNAIGYNVEDNLIYGIRGSNDHLMVVNANGIATDLGAIGMLPNASYYVGDFDLSGNLYITGNPRDIYRIDVDATPLSAVKITRNGPNPSGVADFAFIDVNPADPAFCLIGIEGGGDRLVKYNFASSTATSMDVSFIPITGAINNESGSFGATYSTDGGSELFASNNNSGNIYKIDLDFSNPNNPTAIAGLVGTGETTSNNDGTSCPYAPSPLPCAIDFNLMPQNCTGNTYELQIAVTYNNPNTSSFTVTIDGQVVGVYNYANVPSGAVITIPGLIGDGTTNASVTVSDNCSSGNDCPCENTRTYQEPDCCTFSVDCPADLNLGDFNCNNMGTLPGLPSTLADLAGYGITYSASTGCSTVRVEASDNPVNTDQCTAQTVMRTIKVYLDGNNNMMYDAGEDFSDCTFMYNIVTVPLSVSCPGNSTATLCGTQGQINAAFATWKSQFQTSGGCNPQSTDLTTYLAPDRCAGGTVTIDYMATDACGQSEMCSATFTVIADNTKPQWNSNSPDVNLTTSMGATCPGTPSISLIKDRNNPVTTGTNTIAYSVHGTTFFTPNGAVNDNCTPAQDLEVYVWNVQTNYKNTYNGCMRQIRVVFRLVDNCGNFRNRPILYTIIDDMAPQLTNPPMDMTVQCDGSGNTAALNAWLASNGGAVAVDDCQQVIWSNDFNGLSDGCGVAGSASVTFMASDGCGNAVSSTATFTIIDNLPPVGTCPQGVSGLANPADAPAPDPAGVASYYTDACGSVGASLAYSYQGGNECVGFALHYIYNVFDDCGNTLTCEVIHTGGNTIPLKGNCPQGLSNLKCMADVPAPDLAAIQANYSGLGVINVSLLDIVEDGDNCSGFAVTYVYEVSDDCDSRICEVTHSGLDVKAPKGDCPIGLTDLSCIQDIPGPDLDGVVAGLWDDCDDVEVVLAETIDDTDDCTNFSRTYIYHATDACGNLRICEVTHSGSTQIPNTGLPEVSGLTCIDQVPAPDTDAVAAYFSNDCGNTYYASHWNSMTTNQYCSGFQVTHFYMVSQSCGGMVWASQTFSGTNCPGCAGGDNASSQEAPNLTIPSIKTSNKVSSALGIKAYPNPTIGLINLELEGVESKSFRLQLMDVTGRVVYDLEQEKDLEHTVSFDFNELGLTTGIYYIALISESRTKVEKIIFNLW